MSRTETEKRCETCRWGKESCNGIIYCMANVFRHMYNPPNTECNCQNFAGSHVIRWEKRSPRHDHGPSNAGKGNGKS